jgi:hypothetical protein
LFCSNAKREAYPPLEGVAFRPGEVNQGQPLFPSVPLSTTSGETTSFS